MLELQTPSRTAPQAHPDVGFELGWDHARWAVAPPAPHLAEPSALGDGYAAGRAAFGARTRTPTPAVRQWLKLRLGAWLRGQSVEPVRVTPNHLQQIAVSHCPITRAALAPGEAVIDRVRSDAGYAAGNLVALSVKASHAKARHTSATAAEAGVAAAAAEGGEVGGLSAAEWQRLAVLLGFVEPLEHAHAVTLPLAVLPPNRLFVFNPAQALQAFVSEQLLAPGWSGRIGRIEALIVGEERRRAFKAFFMAFLPRVLERGGASETAPRHLARWAIEDAWLVPLVRERWAAFAGRLSAAECEALVERAARQQPGERRLVSLDDRQATEGWHLATRGYAPLAAEAPAIGVSHVPDEEPRQQRLAW